MNQKAEYYTNSTPSMIASKINEEIKNGWKVISMMADNGCCIVVYEIRLHSIES